MADQAETTVRAFLSAFGEVGLEDLLSFFAADIRYQDARPDGVCDGIDALRREFASQLQAVPKTQVTIRALLSDGRTVMVERVEAFALHGRPVRMEGALVFEVDDAGRISRMRDYYDRGQFTTAESAVRD